MALSRKLPAVAGVGLLALAALVVLVPSVAGHVPMAALVAELGNDYLLLAPVAGLALAGLVVVLATRLASGVTEATPPAVEGTTHRAPGQTVDDSLDSLPPVRVTDRHRRLKSRVRAAAVETVAEVERCSRPEASDRIDAGEWTEDAEAAAFVGSTDVDPPGVGRRVATRLRRENWFRRRVEATVRALDALETEAPA